VATSADLEALMTAGRFRGDLYFRLATHEVRIPPLRERKEDLPLLSDRFLDQACTELGKERVAVPPQLYDYLEGYDFPGSIRELRAMIWDAVSRHSSRMLGIGAFPKLRPRLGDSHPSDAEKLVFPSRLPTLKSAVDLLVEEAVRRANGNQALAAGLVGITPQAMSRRLAHLRAGRGGPRAF
jgi:DNA-binding NtrC family response regulator